VTKLAATVHNPYFIDEVVHFLNQICPGCLSPRESIDLKIMKAFAESSPC
jgi:DNA-directed RNA polymerase-4 subunit 1